LKNLARSEGDYALARSLLEEGLAMARELGGKQMIAILLPILGKLVLLQGSYALARSLFEESLTIWCEVSSKPAIVGLLEGFAHLEAAQEQPGRAVRLFGAAEVLREGIGVPRNVEWPN